MYGHAASSDVCGGDFQLKASIGHGIPASTHMLDRTRYHPAGKSPFVRAYRTEWMLTPTILQIASGVRVSVI